MKSDGGVEQTVWDLSVLYNFIPATQANGIPWFLSFLSHKKQQLPLVASLCGAAACLMRMMTEGVWAMAPIMLHTQITHRKVRKAS